MKKSVFIALVAAALCALFMLSACDQKPAPASSDVPSETSSETSENEGQYIPDWN